jgi:hypothetical protein
MIKVTRVMANYLNTDDRYRIAETMRDAADALEHRQREVVN